MEFVTYDSSKVQQRKVFTRIDAISKKTNDGMWCEATLPSLTSTSPARAPARTTTGSLAVLQCGRKSMPPVQAWMVL